VYRSSATTDAQWAIIQALLPPAGNTGGRGGRREKWPRRLVVDAVFYLVHGGIPWRELPREFPPPSTVWTIFTRWVRAGAWARVHDALVGLLRVRSGRRAQPSAAIIDSQSVRAADTVASPTRGYDAGKKINGRKRHIAVDTNGWLLAVLVTVAGIQDRDGGLHLLARLREHASTITLVWADAGYAGRLVTFAARVWGLTLEVVKRADDQVGFKVLHRRWVVERTFAWISKHRRCVRDYETRIDTSEAMVHIAMIMTMSRRLARHR
jgi:transposase